MNDTATIGHAAPANEFTARVALPQGGHAYLSVTSLAVLSALVGMLTSDKVPTPAAPAVEQADKPAATGLTADEKAAVLGNAQKPEVKTKPATKPAATTSTEPSASAAPADKPSSASTDAGASEKPVAYDQVKALVNALYMIDPKHAVEALAEFNVKNGKELQPQQWPAFVAAAGKKLEALKVAA